MGPLFGIVFFLILLALGGLLFAGVYRLLALGLKNTEKLIRLLISFLLTVAVGTLCVPHNFLPSYIQVIAKLIIYIVLPLSVLLIGFRWYKTEINESGMKSIHDFEEDFYASEPMVDKLIRQILIVLTSLFFGLVFLTMVAAILFE